MKDAGGSRRSERVDGGWRVMLGRPLLYVEESYLVDPASSICLSQRLSHACLSTSLTKVKPRMAH